MKKKKIGIFGLVLTTIFSCAALNVNAATTYTETLPNEVTRKPDSEEYKFNESGIATGETVGIIEFLSTDDKYLLYCSDRNNTKYTAEVKLTKGGPMDYRIAYVLTHGYGSSSAALIEGVTEAKSLQSDIEPYKKGQDMANIWITQVALWNLQNTISDKDLNDKQLSYTKTRNNDTFKLSYSSQMLTAKTLWDNYVSTLVNEANSKEDPATAALSLTGDTKWTKSDNISKTGLITIAPSNDLVTAATYKVSLDNAPEGSQIHKEDGTAISANDEIAAGTKIYITVDNTKIDDKKEYNFTLNASAVGTYSAAYQYEDKTNQCSGEPCQPSVLVGPEQKDIAGSLKLNIIPNTASNISKIIYYIGFIIVLIGAGTIYANVRPKKQESE